VRRAALAALAPVLAAALAGCQSTQEKSAALERAALRAQAGQKPSQQGLHITVPGRRARVLGSTLIHGSEGWAAVVTVQNVSAQPLADVPIALSAADAQGATVYTNTGGGLARSLVSVPYLAPHGRLEWVDDQLQPSGTPVRLHVLLGEGATAVAAPALAVAGVKMFEDPANGPGAEGQVANRSSVAQHELVIYAVARRGGRIVAAGRGQLPQLTGGQSLRFQAYLTGSPAGAAVTVAAPPSTLR
jgi:hypothetical protein